MSARLNVRVAVTARQMVTSGPYFLSDRRIRPNETTAASVAGVGPKKTLSLCRHFLVGPDYQSRKQ